MPSRREAVRIGQAIGQSRTWEVRTCKLSVAARPPYVCVTTLNDGCLSLARLFVDVVSRRPSGTPVPRRAELVVVPGCVVRHQVAQVVGPAAKAVRSSSWAGSKMMSAAEALAVTSSAVSAPTMAEATAGRDSNQARET